MHTGHLSPTFFFSFLIEGCAFKGDTLIRISWIRNFRWSCGASGCERRFFFVFFLMNGRSYSKIFSFVCGGVGKNWVDSNLLYNNHPPISYWLKGDPNRWTAEWKRRLLPARGLPRMGGGENGDEPTSGMPKLLLRKRTKYFLHFFQDFYQNSTPFSCTAALPMERCPFHLAQIRTKIFAHF